MPGLTNPNYARFSDPLGFVEAPGIEFIPALARRGRHAEAVAALRTKRLWCTELCPPRPFDVRCLRLMATTIPFPTRRLRAWRGCPQMFIGDVPPGWVYLLTYWARGRSRIFAATRCIVSKSCARSAPGGSKHCSKNWAAATPRAPLSSRLP